jgi:hypothetical protein
MRVMHELPFDFVARARDALMPALPGNFPRPLAVLITRLGGGLSMEFRDEKVTAKAYILEPFDAQKDFPVEGAEHYVVHCTAPVLINKGRKAGKPRYTRFYFDLLSDGSWRRRLKGAAYRFPLDNEHPLISPHQRGTSLPLDALRCIMTEDVLPGRSRKCCMVTMHSEERACVKLCWEESRF